VRLLYPGYAFFGLIWTFAWIWADSRAHRTFPHRLGTSAAFLVAWPFLTVWALRVPFGRRDDAGAVTLATSPQRSALAPDS
jgi:hypothetical protein